MTMIDTTVLVGILKSASPKEITFLKGKVSKQMEFWKKEDFLRRIFC